MALVSIHAKMVEIKQIFIAKGSYHYVLVIIQNLKEDYPKEEDLKEI